MTVLDDILAHKREEVRVRRAARSPAELRAAAADAAPCRGFASALRQQRERGAAGVIAEIKKASPSKGLIRADFDPAWIARSYHNGGATCLSVLTDERFFQGADAFLQAARSSVPLPVLRKDFVVDAYQLYESRVLGADCVLLIAAALAPTELADLHGEAVQLGLDVLVEVHSAEELETVAPVQPALLGINNRDLHRFETSLAITEALIDRVPEASLAVSESGIHTRADVARLTACGVSTFLIGEAFMRAPDPGTALADLLR